jgi:hypothetical protein
LKCLHACIVLLSVAGSIAPAKAANSRAIIMGIGVSDSCGTWAQNRKSNQWPAEGVWIMGFVSGASDVLDQPLLQDLDPGAVFDWVDNYCRANPLVQLGQAAEAFAAERAQAVH